MTIIVIRSIPIVTFCLNLVIISKIIYYFGDGSYIVETNTICDKVIILDNLTFLITAVLLNTCMISLSSLSLKYLSRNPVLITLPNSRNA